MSVEVRDFLDRAEAALPESPFDTMAGKIIIAWLRGRVKLDEIFQDVEIINSESGEKT